MDRSEVQRLLSLEADGELAFEDRARLEQGLQEVPEAAEDRAFFGLVGTAIREEPLRAPVGLGGRILAQVEAEVGAAEGRETASAGSRPAPMLWLRRSAVAAAAVLLISGLVHVAQLPDKAFADDPPAPQHFVPDEELDRMLEEGAGDGAPRSATLRWLLGHGAEDE